MMVTIYDTENRAKPRYDGGGSEFGIMHRDLGPGFLMFDIDRMSVKLNVNLELKKEDTAFIEYRRINEDTNFVALFELKGQMSDFTNSAIDPDYSNTAVQIEMCRRLDCRLFVVFGSRSPFDFYEYIAEDNAFSKVGTLSYQDDNREAAVKVFWKYKLKIER